MTFQVFSYPEILESLSSRSLFLSYSANSHLYVSQRVNTCPPRYPPYWASEFITVKKSSTHTHTHTHTLILLHRALVAALVSSMATPELWFWHTGRSSCGRGLIAL